MKISSAILLLFLWSCTSQEPPKPAVGFDPVQVRAEVSQMLHDYHEAMRTGGLEAEFEFLDQSPAFFWIPPGYEQILSYDSVATILRHNDLALQSIVLEWDSLNINAINDTLAQYYGTLYSTTVDTSGTSHRSLLIESGLIIKRSDGWKLLNGQSAYFPKE
jgi:hypothetical protein